MAFINWWKLNENLTDSLYNYKNTSTITSSGTIGYKFASHCKGVELNSNAYLTLKNPFIDSTNWGISFWVADLGAADWCDIISFSVSNYGPENDGHCERLEFCTKQTDGSRDIKWFGDGNLFLNSSSVMKSTPNKLYNVIITLTGKHCSLYIDGELKLEKFDTKPIANTNINSIYIGSRMGRMCSHILVSDIRFFDYSLSKYEIQELANNCIASYSFDYPNYRTTDNIVDSIRIGNNFTKIDNYTIEASGSAADSYFYLKLRNPLTLGDHYTISFLARNIAPGKELKFLLGGFNGGESGTISVHNGWNQQTFTVSKMTADRTTEFIVDDLKNPQCKFILSNFQIEKKDYATLFTKNHRGYENISDNSGWGHDLVCKDVRMSNDTPVGAHAITFLGECRSKAYCEYFPQILKNITFNCWAKRNAEGAPAQYIMSHGRDTGANGISIMTRASGGTSLLCGNYQTYNIVSANTHMEIGKWYMLTGTYDGQLIKFYINGVKEGEKAWTGDICYDQSGQTVNNKFINALTFGKMAFAYLSDGNYFPFSGDVGEAQVYATALSEAEIKDLYESHTCITNQQVLVSKAFNETDTVNIFKTGVAEALLFKEESAVEIYNNNEVKVNELIEK